MDLGDVARAIIDDNRYMVHGTADESGRPVGLTCLLRALGVFGPLLGLLAGGAALAEPRGAPGAEHRGLRLAGAVGEGPGV
jgi:hypothetical protein